MKIKTVDGDTPCSVLSRYLGSDSDALEREFWRLNPHVLPYPIVFPSGVDLMLPAASEGVGAGSSTFAVSGSEKRNRIEVVSSWD